MEREFSRVPLYPQATRGSTCLSSPSPDLPSYRCAGSAWQRTESIDSEYSETNESSLEHPHSSGEDLDGVDMQESIAIIQQPKPSPQVSLPRRGSQDSVTGSLRLTTRPPPATPRIVNHSLPPLGHTPAPTGLDNSAIFQGSVKHGRPLEAMCVDPFERKKRRVGGGGSGEASRFRTDFMDVAHIGKGSFSDVFKVTSRIDGQFYAIKRLKKQVSSESERNRCEREARMHAFVTCSFDKAPSLAFHIIRYHNAWFEDARLFIQTELCPSCLPDVIGETGGPLSESLVVTVIRDVGCGLKFLHSLGLVHLDIKPANILISPSGAFKIGDLGLVSPAGEPAEVTSGDARYLPREILLNNYKHLPKADVFSLGATALECMIAQRLEAEGEEWHRLRDGQLPLEELEGRYSEGLIKLVRVMMAPDPEDRPNCDEIVTCEEIRLLSQSVPSPTTIAQSLQHTRQKLRKLFTST